MSSDKQKPSIQENSSRVTEEYRILHKVAQILQTPAELKTMLQNAMRASMLYIWLRILPRHFPDGAGLSSLFAV
jgi:hypothetical protein